MIRGEVCTNGEAIRGYPTVFTWLQEEASQYYEVISLVASDARDEAFGRVMDKCYLGLLLL